jgi:hypothetical protein
MGDEDRGPREKQFFHQTTLPGRRFDERASGLTMVKADELS